MLQQAMMSSRRFVFVTRTHWQEPPRLRHQLARLLASYGAQVIFGEKPLPWFRKRQALSVDCVESGISFFRHRELIHHRLCVSQPIEMLSDAFLRRSVRAALQRREIGGQDVIVNFNYDYDFLRDIYPHTPIITILNDDFVNKVPPPFRGAAARMQRQTCRSSDEVLTTSSIIAEQLRTFCRPEVFLPWADVSYQSPDRTAHRNIILSWGFIDRRMDFNLVCSLAEKLLQAQSDLQLLFVGPLADEAIKHKLFRDYPNVMHQGTASLAQLPLDRVCASMIPYVSGVPAWEAIVVPNKAYQLLARGLPLLISGMPRFLKAPFVYRLDQGDAIEAIARAREEFLDVQAAIEPFVKENSATARVEQFREVVERARAARGNPCP